jgi:type I restriction enzyme, S subunit
MENIGQYISRYVKGKVPKQLFETADKNTLPYLSPDFLRGKANPEFYAKPTSKTVQIEDGEVIVLWDGSNAGEIFISKKGILGSTMVKLEFDEENIFKPYFSYSFQYLEYFLKAKTAGSGIPHADKGVIKKLDFFKPPKPEQTAIATILSKVDEAIEATQNSIKAAEKLKKSLMQNLLTGKLKPDCTWRTDDEFYVDEKFGKVPVGWEVARVKDYGFVQTGKTPPTAESNVFSEVENEPRYPFITPGDLGESKFVSTSERFVTEKGIRYSYKLPINSICVVCIGSTIGKIGITKTEACTNQQINTLIANENNSGEFFFYMMEYRKPHFKEIAGINATPQINKSGFNKYKLLRPKEKSEQEKIVSQLNSFDEENIIKQTKIRTLQCLKKSLMQNLLTGKVRLDVGKVNKIISEQ